MFIELLQYIVWLDTCQKGMPYKIIRFVLHQQDNFCLKERNFKSILKWNQGHILACQTMEKG